MMGHSIFGWSYPPGCSGPPEPRELPEPSKLVEQVLGLLEDAGADTATNDKIVNLIEEWEARKESELTAAQDKAYEEFARTHCHCEAPRPDKTAPCDYCGAPGEQTGG